MDQPAAAAQPLDVREYMAILWRRKWTILLITILTVGSALAFSFRQTPIYTSTAGLLVKPAVTPLSQQNVPPASLISIDTEKRIAGSTSVAWLAASELPGISADRIRSSLDVSVGTNELVLEISYSDPNPVIAQRGATAVAKAYVTFKTRQAIAALTRQRQALQEQIAGVQKKLDAAAEEQKKAAPNSSEALVAETEVQNLTSQKTGLESLLGSIATSTVDPGEIIEAPELPTEPSSPRILVNGALALVVGLALGIGLAFLRERLDDRIYRREQLEEAAGAPVLSVVPKVPGWHRKGRAELTAAKAPKGAGAEAYRTIRTNVLFIGRNGDVKVLAVTSPGAGEGKTTTAANLAVSLAQAGKRVIVVSADLRKPRLHSFFSLHNEVGLSNVLARQATVYEAVQRPAVDGLRVIASGPVPPNPAELLASNDIDVVLGQLKGAADYVIIDTPPVFAVSDALSLAPRVDGVVVVADAQTTRRGAVAHVRHQLDQTGGNIVGAVLNNFDPSRARYYPAYYRYAYTYRYREDGSSKDQRRGRGKPTDDRPPETIWRTDDIWNRERPDTNVDNGEATVHLPESPVKFSDAWAHPRNADR